jgi:hypothetical protein
MQAPAPSPDKIPIRNAVLCEADSVRVRLRKRGTGVGEGVGGEGGEGGTTVVQYRDVISPLGYCTWSSKMAFTAQYNKKTLALARYRTFF